MLKYKIFHLGYGGRLFDSDSVFDIRELEFDTQEEAFEFLRARKVMNELREDLTFVVLPTYKV